mmetsp:Transcript_26610/g.26855  ORF Transcript_26610/g.26855 Transcript_26610/m.26855 type:complete len:82 (+) Transcript_26610:109-354(+)
MKRTHSGTIEQQHQHERAPCLQFQSEMNTEVTSPAGPPHTKSSFHFVSQALPGFPQTIASPLTLMQFLPATAATKLDSSSP